MKHKKETYYFKSGEVRYEQYFVNGQLHRTDGPADVCYFESGEVRYEQYFVNGQFHRTDGPAVVCYFESGEVKYERYWISDQRATKEQIKEIKFNLQFDKDVMEVL